MVWTGQRLALVAGGAAVVLVAVTAAVKSLVIERRAGGR
jgi:hypothetical protein